MLRVLAASVLVVACGSDPLKKPADGGTAGTGGAAMCPEGPTGSEVCDPGPGYGETTTPISVTSVRATMVDENGAPLADVMVFICGTSACSMPAWSDSDGRVSIAYSLPMQKPAFKYGDGIAVGRFEALLAESTEEVDLGTVGTPRLPSPGVCLDAGATLESNGVRLSLAADARVDVKPIAVDYPEADRTFRAAEPPITLAPPSLVSADALDAVFALAPTGAVVCPPATVELPNSPGYAPGTEVDLLVHGTDIEENWAAYAGWTRVATGRVDESGERIETIDGGLPIISNVGVRAR
jgi:hypothetical protein